MSKLDVAHPVTVEILASWRATKLCAKLNFSSVTFEGEAVEVIKVVNNDKDCWAWYGQVIEDVKRVLQSRSR